MTKKIQLQTGETTLVDDEDYEFLSRFKWRYGGQPHRKYVVASGDRMEKSQVTYYMHTLILGGRMGDHADGNTLDNRKANVRVCTVQENGWNKGKPKGCRHGKPTSKYKGVRKVESKAKGTRWLAFFKHVEPGAHKSTGRTIYIGYFPTEIEAAKAYNREIVKYRGEFAWLNPIPNRTNKSDAAHD